MVSSAAFRPARAIAGLRFVVPVVVALGGLALAWALTSLAYVLVVAASAKILGLLSGLQTVRDAIAWLPGDDVHAMVALDMMGNVHPERLILGLPFDDMLVQRFPQVFGPPSMAQEAAWVSLVAESGSSAVGLHLAGIVANAILMATGVALAGTGARWHDAVGVRRRALLGMLIAGLLFQAYGAGSQLSVSWDESGGGGIVLGLVATKLLDLDGTTYAAAVDANPLLLSLLLNVLLVAGSALLGIAVMSLVSMSPPRPRWGWLRLPGPLMIRTHVAAPLALALALVLLQTPFRHGVATEAAALGDGELLDPDPGLILSEAEGAGEQPAMAAAAQPAAPAGPSVVTIILGSEGYAYSVNGSRESIRGIGYNAVTAGLSADERAARYERDFTWICAYRANTIIGWDQSGFDEVLLESATRHRLGVVLPFALEPTTAYENASVRQRLMEDIRAWVERYRNSPSLRMWGLGNEVLHGIANVSQPSVRSTRPAAFASFLVEAADYIHQLDPNHPVVYRDAEDVFLEPVARALAKGNVSRPWFVYGMNFFTYRVGAALESGPALRLPQPLLISEFGPAGLKGSDRAAAYVKMWSLIRSKPGKVLGGAAYVWTTAGPEPLDRSFGLTDENDRPVDQSLRALGTVFQQDEMAEIAQQAGGEIDPALEARAARLRVLQWWPAP